ncbi:MAG: DUF2100 domain-containing protein [Methanobacterium sp.]
MDKIRYRQAQELIGKAGKSKGTKEVFKKPQEGIIDTKLFGEILNEMMDLEDYLLDSRPTHYLKKDEAQEFCEQIISIRKQLDSILGDFGVLEKADAEGDIKTLSDKYLILTTKSNFKKVLTKFTVDPQKIVVAGVPLEIDDMKRLNPYLPDVALKSIEKRISHVKNDITRKKEQFNLENVLVIVENDESGEILAERAREFYNAQTITLESLKDITPEEFLKLLSGL